MGDVSSRFRALRDEVEANGNVMTVSMEKLRNTLGKDRLGDHVVNTIRAQLRRSGLGFGELDKQQDHTVRLYVNGTTEAKLIFAVEHLGSTYDHRIHEFASQDMERFLKAIDKVREAVEEFDDAE